MAAKRSYISLDQAEEILVYLPIKSLIRFRSVSKQWSLLFSDPYFTKNHKAPSSNDNINLFFCGTGIDQPCTLRIDQSNNLNGREATLRATTLTTSPLIPKDTIRMGAAHCNGLLCILTELGTVIVWNPTTYESKRFDTPQTLNPKSCIGLGFGYVSTNDEYMVAVAGSYFKSRTVELHILSLKTGLWKVVGNNERCFNGIPKQVAVAFNSCLYWVKGFIICYDLERDMIRFELEHIQTRTVLGILGESLCSTTYNCLDIGSNVRVRNEENWSEATFIPFLGRRDTKGNPMEIMCLVGNNKMLVREPDKIDLFLYNLNGRTAERRIRFEDPPNYHYRPGWTITSYALSLVRVSEICVT